MGELSNKYSSGSATDFVHTHPPSRSPPAGSIPSDPLFTFKPQLTSVYSDQIWDDNRLILLCLPLRSRQSFMRAMFMIPPAFA